jgi:hypothetical protein
MNFEKMKIGDLNFEITPPHSEEELPSFEIENDASMVFVKVELSQAIALNKLLTRFIDDCNKSLSSR